MKAVRLIADTLSSWREVQNAADLARATKYTPQAISIALKRMARKAERGDPAEVPANLAKAIRKAMNRKPKAS